MLLYLMVKDITNISKQFNNSHVFDANIKPFSVLSVSGAVQGQICQKGPLLATKWGFL